MPTYPTTVDKDLGGISNWWGSNLLEVLHAPLLQELQNGGRSVTDRHVSHESKIFDLKRRQMMSSCLHWIIKELFSNFRHPYQADSGSLGCLGRADHAPKCVVQLTRLGQFTVATDRRVDTTQVRQGGCVGQSIKRENICFLFSF